MEIVQNRSGIYEATKNWLVLSQVFKLLFGTVKVDGSLEIRMDLLPESAHEMPALRPGISCLLVARSGRRAPLQFLGKGWMRELARGCGRLVQRPAATTGGLNRKAHEIFMPPRKAQVHAVVSANAEQFFTARAAPFGV